jgi:hypothetical protein
MSTSQDASQKFHQYDSADRQLLVGLLHEYSDKLVKASREVARKRTNKKEANKFLYFLLGFSMTSSYLFWQLFLTRIKSNGDNNLYLTVSDNLFLTVLVTSVFIFLPLSLFFANSLMYSFLSFGEAENDLLERDARMIANRLESAMRLTVEVADQIEINLARKLELDLRIDDASSALDYYYSVVNLKTKQQAKSREVVS